MLIHKTLDFLKGGITTGKSTFQGSYIICIGFVQDLPVTTSSKEMQGRRCEGKHFNKKWVTGGLDQQIEREESKMYQHKYSYWQHKNTPEQV
jgi:hypothetical protein